MSQLIELLDQLSRAGITTLLLLLAAASGFVSIIRNWRLALPVMIIQYVLVGILLARAIEPSVALIKPLAGAIVCFTLSISAQRADAQRARRGESVASDRLERPNWQHLPAQVMVRALATILVLTAAFGAAIRFPLPGNARELGLGAYMLIGCGILIIGTASEALNSGLGILMLISGFELVYTPLESSISVSVLLGLVTLLVGLSVAYLTLADGSALHAGDVAEFETPAAADDQDAEDDVDDEGFDDDETAEDAADEDGYAPEEPVKDLEDAERTKSATGTDSEAETSARPQVRPAQATWLNDDGS